MDARPVEPSMSVLLVGEPAATDALAGALADAAAEGDGPVPTATATEPAALGLDRDADDGGPAEEPADGPAENGHGHGHGPGDDGVGVDLLGTDRPDAVVLVGDPTLTATAADALAATGAPVVAYTEAEPTARYVEGHVVPGAGPAALLRELERAREGETRIQLGRARERVTRLHDGTASLASSRSVRELFERTVDVARGVLSFDHCCVAVLDPETDEMVVRARSSDADWLRERVSADASLAGRAVRTGRTVFVTDAATVNLADPDAHGSAITVPVGEDAVFQAISRTPEAFDETDRELAELLAAHAGEAYGRLRAQADLTRRERTMSELHEAAPRLVDADTDAELFGLVVEIAERVLAFDRSVVFIADEEAFVRQAESDPAIPERLPREFGALAATHDEDRTVHADDMREHPVAEPHSEAARSLLSVPFGGDAVFQAVADEPGAFDDTDRELAELLVSYATATRERIRSETALRESRRTVERLHDATADIAAADTEAAVVERAMTASEEVLAFDRSTLMLREGEYLVPVVDSDGAPEDGSREMHVSEGVAGRTAREGESVLVGDVDDHEDAAPAHATYRSGLSVPIGDLGVFQAVATEPHAFDDDDVRLAELLMSHVAVSLERVRAGTELREERDRLSALFENVPDAAVSFEFVDDEPVARAVNPAFVETFGYEADAVVGESVDEFIVPPDDHEEAVDLNERLRSGESLRRECRRKTADGVRDFLMYVVPLERGARNVGGYAIYSDITARKERERALERQNERLDEFASVVSHDLRNPLSIAEGYLELARETGEEAHLETVADAVARMRRLIDDLLRLAREGRVVGETDCVDLATAAREAWATVDTAGATLAVPDEGAAAVEADRDRLVELFENLFRNAAEHAGEAPAVRVEATDGGFVVADDGPGVDPAERESVFDVGVSTAEGGTGFGLAIVRRIAEAHGWSVELREGEEGGAAFAFTTG